jgi:hypothetical protein
VLPHGAFSDVLVRGQTAEAEDGSAGGAYLTGSGRPRLVDDGEHVFDLAQPRFSVEALQWRVPTEKVVRGREPPARRALRAERLRGAVPYVQKSPETVRLSEREVFGAHPASGWNSQPTGLLSAGLVGQVVAETFFESLLRGQSL